MSEPDPDPATPPITVVVSTRNRSDCVIGAIRSILANDYPNFELLVIDQSDTDDTEKALQPFLADRRFSYVPSATIGVSSGRNIGIEHAKSEFIAITDDDCEAPSDWLREMIKALQSDDRIGMVFGNVLAGDHLSHNGFIPTYERKEPYLAESVRDKNRVRGIGACMGLRRSICRAVKGFDPMLGPGAPLRCHEEGDLAIRMLMAGYAVFETPDIKIIHHGFRTWKQGRDLALRNYYGIGAALAKYVKLRRRFIVPVIAYEWGHEALGQFVRNLVVQRRLSGATPIVAFCRGFWAGLRQPVDPITGLYRAR